ncbi:hypothetical protein EST38_g13438 [Candolleomyces aberdarensis]|uniref:Uncharacterized protein n=1 Tax=Candolleomyces aberdarensis TaxID=2316362 RepID=A0A4Q2D1T3_9AGAR|nr:hypothetical protein EST38_g13438 [Candolleomyces aberdarensis]
MSAGNVDHLMQLLAQLYPNEEPPVSGHDELYALIDSIKEGDVAWDSFSITYTGESPSDPPVPPWMTQPYEVWFRDPLKVVENQFANPDFNGKIDYAPKRVFRNNKRQYTDLLSGNHAWRQAVWIPAHC